MDEFMSYLLSINDNYDVEKIERAYKVAEDMHEGQLRKSGEPYFIHPVAVARILADLGMDTDTIVAGLMHDVVEDTPYTYEELKEEFGTDVALLVDGVTKLGSLKYESKEELQAENLRKMFLAMSKDIRVLIIKLADRLHNLRTINYMTEDKIREKCKETLEIYAPLANRLGMFNIKFEMEDIALKQLEPDFYYDLVRQMNQKKDQRDANIKKVISEMQDVLDTLSINYEIKGRSKHFYSIYKKMKDKHKQLDEIFDLTAIRVLVDTVKDCYSVLGVVHTMWRPIPGRFKDYIAMPKSNMYQSLHTTVFGSDGQPFEIQIRTHEMHHIAEYGIAAHWKYKEGVDAADEEVKLAWLRQTLEWNKDVSDSREFMETLKVDLFSNQVFVFTPAGQVIELPAGSTPIDFAFKIHSAVGAKCIGAKINGKIVPIDHVLENGNIVEIITSSNSKGPSIDWLKIAKSSNAKNKIRAWLKKENKSENVEKGKELLEKYVKRKGYDPAVLLKQQRLNRVAKTMNFANTEDMYASLGYGGTMLSKTLAHLNQFYDEERQTEQKKQNIEFFNHESKASTQTKSHCDSGVKVKGVDNLLIRFSKCCSPVPGDDIVGFITKGRGISVHKADCPNVVSMPEEEKQRFIEVEWDSGQGGMSFESDIYVIAEDRKGLFSDISKVCDDMDVSITEVNARSTKDGMATVNLTIMISNTKQIEKVINKLRQFPGIAEINRGTMFK